MVEEKVAAVVERATIASKQILISIRNAVLCFLDQGYFTWTAFGYFADS